MLRITQVSSNETGTCTRITLEGSLRAESIATLLDVFNPYLSASGSKSALLPEVALDVAGLRFLDAAGTAALRDLRSQGVTIVGCSPLVRALLKLEDSHERSA